MSRGYGGREKDRYGRYRGSEWYPESRSEAVRDVGSGPGYSRSRGEERYTGWRGYGEYGPRRSRAFERPYEREDREFNDRYEDERASLYNREQDRGWAGEYGGEVSMRYDNPHLRSRMRAEYDEEQEQRGWWERAADEVSSWFGDEEARRRREMDEARRGAYRGRGPRNYRRSDDRICDDVNDRLTDHPFLDAYNIDVKVTTGEVLLSGTVKDRFSKRLAEDIAEDVPGVQNVENRLRVEREEERVRNIPITEPEKDVSKSATTRST
jgi:osmotically-inducible protein OsmY